MSLEIITYRVILRTDLGDALERVKVIQLKRVKGESMEIHEVTKYKSS